MNNHAAEARGRGSDLVHGGLLSLSVVVVFLALSAETRHWCVFPLLICGILITSDALSWVRGRIDVLDPIGILGVVGTHHFVLAPLLHIHLDQWMRYVEPPPDWREWLGWMAVLNAFGLLLYRFSRNLARPVAPSATVWVVKPARFSLLLATGLVVTACLQAWVYLEYEGVAGYVDAYVARSTKFRGSGWVFMISESFPILLSFAYATFAERVPAARRWVALTLFLIVVIACALLFGGLRGSRSNTVWALFWAVGVIHFRIRPMPRTLVYVGMVLLVVFMYAYGFYKAAGRDAVAGLEGADARAALEERSGLTLQTTLLMDLARADVQAFVLYQVTRDDSDYELALGRTYVSSLSLLVPRVVFPDPPPRKGQEGTDALFGRGAYASGYRASNVYGLAGEGLLNFGPYGAPFLFLLLGVTVGAIHRFSRQWHHLDARFLLYPFAIIVSFVLLVADSDNILFLILKSGLVPAAAVFFGTIRVPREHRTDRADRVAP